MRKFFVSVISLLLFFSAYPQTYSPITLTGFNVDAFAETAPNSLSTTSASLDLTNHIMYTQAFAAATGLSAGVVNNGVISYTSGSVTKNFQLAPYTGFNALSVPTGTTNKLLSLATAGSYARLSLLLFATEATCNISITLRFTDGTFYNAGNFPIQDWFNGTNAVYSSFGRCILTATAPYNADGLPTNPRFYSLDISVPCGFQTRSLQSIGFTWASGTTTNSAAYILALSGIGVASPGTITPTIVNARCTQADGSIALNIPGGSTGYSFLWNTTPAQTTATATNLIAGNYSCTITNPFGCSSSYSGTVGRLSPVTVTAAANPVTVCIGNNTTLTATASGGSIANYTWTPGNISGNNVPVSPAINTTYRVTGQDNFGCNDTAYVTVNVNTVPVASFSVSPDPSCTGDTVVVNYTGNAGAAASYNWNFGGGNIISGNNAGPYKISYVNAGTTTMNLAVNENGCASSTAQQTLNIKQRYTASFTISSDSICSGKNITISYTGNGNAAANYSWDFGNGIIQQGSGQGPYVVAFNNNNNPYLSLGVSSNGCTSSVFHDTLVVISKPVAAFTANPISGCDSITSIFNNSSQYASSYSWAFGDGNVSAAIAPSHKYYNGTFNVQLIAQNYFCYDTLLRNNYIQVKPTYTASFSLSQDSICSGKTITIAYTGNGPAGATYNWNFGGGIVSQGSGQGPYTVLFANNTNPYLSLSVDNTGCISPLYKDTITVILQPVASFTADTLYGCGSLHVTFINSSQNTINSLWTFGDGNTSTTTSPVHTYSPGTYSVRLIAANHFCYDTSSVSSLIKVDATPVASFGSHPAAGTTLPVSKANFSFTNNSSGADNYKWLFGDGDSSVATNPSHHFGIPGNFAVTLYAINSVGCTDTAVLQPYIIIADSTIKIPNAFSPNGDGINDTWNIRGLIGQDKAVVEIYDRWGRIVHHSSGNYTPWNGTINGKPLPTGIYYYIVRADPDQQAYTGWVYLVK